MGDSVLTPLPYRACDLCQFGSGHPEATCRQPIPVEIVRAYGGACGPEARHLHAASWDRA
jgi:hypothetical protein